MEQFKNWIESENKWLNAKKLNELPNKEGIVVVITQPEVITREYQGKDITKLEMQVEMEQKQYTLALNKTNARELSKELSEDLSKWIGKALKLDTIPTPKGDSIRARVYSFKSLNQQPASAGANFCLSKEPVKEFNHTGSHTMRNVDTPLVSSGQTAGNVGAVPHIPFNIQKNLKEDLK